MNRFFCLLLLLSPLLLTAQERPAQERFEVFDGLRDFVGGPRHALIISLPGVREKMAEKVWKDYLGKFGGKTRKVKEIKGSVTSDIEIYPIGGFEKMNLYYQLESDKQNSTLTVWFELKGDMIRPAGEAKPYREAVQFMQQYGHQIVIAQVEEEADEEEKTLKGLEKEMEKLKRDQAGYYKDIEQARDRIARAEKQIEENTQAQEQSVQKIGLQQERLKAVQERLRALRK